MKNKLQALESYLADLPAFAIAFSGGVDSTFLLAAAKKAAGAKVVAVSVDSQFVPREEIESAVKLAQSIGVRHIVLPVDIFEYPDVVTNSARRCYFCKKAVFSRIREVVVKEGITRFLHGVNLDDLKDYRPGLQAAEELGFLSPLADIGLTKSEIREFSRQLGLPTWNKPSQSCLATRIPYDTAVGREELNRVEKGEAFLHRLGFEQVRVRCHGEMARVEVEPAMIEKIIKRGTRETITEKFKAIGFEIVSLDMEGYKTGKMNNEILRSKAGTDLCDPSRRR